MHPPLVYIESPLQHLHLVVLYYYYYFLVSTKLFPPISSHFKP